MNIKMLPETKIEEIVVNHFKGLKFATKKKYKIQMGSDNREADIVIYKPLAFLGHPLDHIAVIVECKAEGKVSHGIPQLHSYLCATDTRLGVFANSRFFSNWKYYENYGRNDIQQISREEFLTILHNESQEQEDLQCRIQVRTEQRIEQAATRSTTPERIAERRELIINKEAVKRITENDFRSATERVLRIELNNLKKQQTNKITSLEAQAKTTEQRLKNEIASLKAEGKIKTVCLWASILISGFLIFALIASLS